MSCLAWQKIRRIVVMAPAVPVVPQWQDEVEASSFGLTSRVVFDRDISSFVTRRERGWPQTLTTCTQGSSSGHSLLGDETLTPVRCAIGLDDGTGLAGCSSTRSSHHRGAGPAVRNTRQTSALPPSRRADLGSPIASEHRPFLSATPSVSEPRLQQLRRSWRILDPLRFSLRRPRHRGPSCYDEVMVRLPRAISAKSKEVASQRVVEQIDIADLKVDAPELYDPRAYKAV